MSTCHDLPIYTDPEDGRRYCSACDSRQSEADTKIEDEDVEHAMIAVEGEFARRLGLA